MSTTIPISLGSRCLGRTLLARKVDENGDQIGDDITAGFVEFASGDYQLTFDASGFDGTVKLFDAASGQYLTCGRVEGSLFAAERDAIADALLTRANAVDGKTVQQALRIVAAILAGKVSGAGSGIERFSGLDGVTPRVEVAADAVGNRTNITYIAD